MYVAAAIFLAYLIGSIPSAYIAGKLRGVDLRKQGSGNLGATNVARSLGWETGLVVLAADCLKGFLPVAVLPLWIHPVSRWTLVLIGVATIVGHVRPIFLLTRGGGGGKGVATGAGVFLALAWLPLLIALAVFALVVLVTRFMSLGSLSGALALPIALLLQLRNPMDPVFLASIPIVLFVVWTHRANIARLRNGKEPAFEFSRRGSR